LTNSQVPLERVDDLLAQEQGIFTYPNPASGSTMVVTNLQPGQAANLRLVDLQGKVVRQHTIQGAAEAEETPLSLDGLVQGIYFLNLDLGTRVVTTKIIVR
ncbi:MAG TPA: T9SS type A sorting domain-containing protein, partial [Bacteroidales bacterium]|nr:T9SS type A sorting domain-containing protein [Bacteroidales bacterium]